MKRLIQYIKDSLEELKKVVWPTKQKLLSDTLSVIVVSVAVGFFIGLVDYLLNQSINLFIH